MINFQGNDLLIFDGSPGQTNLLSLTAIQG